VIFRWKIWTQNEILHTKNQQTTLWEGFIYKNKISDLELCNPVCTYNTYVTDNLQFTSRQLFDEVQSWMCLFGWTRHQSNSLVWRRYRGALQLQVIEYVVFLLFHSSAWGVGASGDYFRPHVRRAIVSGCAYDVIRPLHVWGLWTKPFKEKCYSIKNDLGRFFRSSLSNTDAAIQAGAIKKTDYRLILIHYSWSLEWSTRDVVLHMQLGCVLVYWYTEGITIVLLSSRTGTRGQNLANLSFNPFKFSTLQTNLELLILINRRNKRSRQQEAHRNF